MNDIKKRANEYAKEHYMKNGASLIRAYVAGAESERKIANSKYKVFISGKVSDLEYLVAYGIFSNKDRELSAMGYKVVNPMKICKKNWSRVRCMIVCLWNLMLCDKVYQIPNWQCSKGARIEYRFAKFFKKEVL